MKQNYSPFSLLDEFSLIKKQYEITEHEFNRIGELIYQRSGIVLSQHKRDMVYHRLSRILRSHGFTRFSQYLAILEKDKHGPEWQVFINAMTTNLTSFFREAHHFPILAKHANQRRHGYKVWSSASSTGEEPCSIAIQLDEVLGTSINGPRIWATDIDTDVIATAERGIYRAVDIESLPQERKRRYFMRGTGEQAGMVKIKPEIRAAIHYNPLNLLADYWDVPGPFDAIFCRNVMIYFDKKTQKSILERFSGMLKPGGLLFAGHSENVTQINDAFSLLGQTVYRLSKDKP